jgi:hypothetical protein
MSETSLVVPNQAAIQTGGLGVDFSNPLFRIEPATISITKDGKYKVSDDGGEYEELFVTFLDMPDESRGYYINPNDEEMFRTKENLMCFSSDMIAPSDKAKVPQSPKCAGCSRSDWKPYREAKARGISGKSLKELIPPCEPVYRVELIDTVYRIPLRMYIRSTRRASFEAGRAKVARQLHMMQAQGRNPNIFDVKFRMSLNVEVKGPYRYYVPVFSDIKCVTSEEREAFGKVYIKYIQFKQAVSANRQDASAEAEIAAASAALDIEMTTPEAPATTASAVVLEGEYVTGLDGEIRI